MRPRRPLIEWTAVFIAVGSLLISLLGGYTHNDKEITSRVSVLESQRVDDRESLHRIERDVKGIDSDVKRLVEWAMGKK